jgi:peptide/nickel transport system substrate-binding protein
MLDTLKRMTTAPGWLGVLCCIGILVSACAAPAPSPGGSESGQAGATGQAAAPSAPKTLQIALQGFEEPKEGVVSYGTANGFDGLEHLLIFHAGMTVYDPTGQLVPRLVERIPSVQGGDWVLHPDGRMDVTWKLKPDLQWHDGTPLSAEDFVFGSRVVHDPEVPASRPAWSRLVADVEATDARTLVMHWRQPSFLGSHSTPPALPRHLLQQLHQAGDKQVFINSPIWTTEWVGLGPYRLANWQRGSFMEGVAFDRYALGRPKIDRVIVRYVGDVNAIIAGVLSRDLDIVPMGARLDAGQIVAVREGWGPDGGTAFVNPFGIRTIWMQMRDPTAPWTRDVRIRRAMSHATDRQGMSDALQYGLTPPADTFISTEESAFRVLDSQGFNRYPYDPNRVRQLMAEAGYTPGAEGLFRDSSGQPLEITISATGQGGNVQEIETVSSQWRNVGFNSSPVPLPPQAANLDERKNTVRGGFLWPWSLSLTAAQNLISAEIPTERTVWKGRNYGGYSSPVFDDLYERFTTAVEPAVRDRTVADIMKLLADEVPLIPIYYYGNGIVVRKGLQGPGQITPLQTASSWNIQEWVLQ